MTGYNMVLKIRRLEETAHALGFMFSSTKYDDHREYGSRLSLKPINDKLPVYTRDAEVFTGTLEELEVWLRGVEWARNYDMLLRISDEKKRATAEDKCRKRQEEERIKAEKKAIWAVLSNGEVNNNVIEPN